MDGFSIFNYDLIIFDCDGVILDSNELKSDAFAKVVEDYPLEVQEAFVSYCRNSFGVSRYEKFKVFFEKFAKVEFNQFEYERLLNCYADICKRDYLTCGMTNGSLELIKTLKEAGKNLNVASGSDEEELREVFQKRELTHYFDDIFGSPKSKVESTGKILRKYQDKKVLFIGDALSDIEAAEYFNLDSIYVSGYSIQSDEKNHLCRGKANKTVKYLIELF